MNEITNLWKEDTDENIVKSWLVGLTDGQTYPINDRFLPRITTPLFCGNFDCIEGEWDDIIGPCIRCHIDDEILEPRAKEIVKGLNEFIERINANPQKYFPQNTKQVNDCDSVLERVGYAIDGVFGSVDNTTGAVYIADGGKTYVLSIAECEDCEDEYDDDGEEG